MAVAVPALWRSRATAAVRSALACSIIGGVTFFGPEAVRNLLTFSAFSYVTAMSILLSEAVTVSDAVRGGWYVVGAMVPVLITCVPLLWVIGAGEFSGGMAAVAVGVTAFVVALPEKIELLGKQIGFGMAVVVFVGRVVGEGRSETTAMGFVMLPVKVVSCTALGALASVLAMMLPFPRLSSSEIRKFGGLYCENGVERVKLLVGGFNANNKAEAVESIAEAKSLSIIGTKLLKCIQSYMRGMAWEKPRIKNGSSNYAGMEEKLQKVEVTLRGMEIAMACPKFTFATTDEELHNSVEDLKLKAISKLERCFSTRNSTENLEPKYVSPLKFSSITPENLSASFFFRCMEILSRDDSNAVSIVGNNRKIVNSDETIDFRDRENPNWKNTLSGIISNMCPTNQSFRFAIKCSITLGLSVFLGLIYSKQNGYWSGVAVAISFATERQAIFTIANARAQGTAMGSFYGVICTFILRKYEYLWLLPLLPWVIFSSLLVHSRMYGRSGGLSASIGALLILGRKNYGLPTEFANGRIAEVCIGLLCFVTVEIIFNPTRASNLARVQFSKSLGSLQDCIKTVTLNSNSKSKINFDHSCIHTSMKKRHENLKSQVTQLEKFIAEANFEPNFWFKPFQSSHYVKLLGSLLKSVDILQLLLHEINFFLSLEMNQSDFLNQLSEEMDVFIKKTLFSLRFMELVTMVKSLNELQNKNQSLCNDVEMGKPSNHGCSRALELNEEDGEKILSSFCQKANEAVNRICRDGDEDGDGKNLKGQMVICLNSIGFCFKCLMRETMEMEKQVIEVLKLENPSFHIDFQEISSKIKILNLDK